MYDFLVSKTVKVLAPRLECEHGSLTYDKLQYGTHVFYINAVKTLLLIIVSLILGIFPYVVAFALAYGSLRVFSFGIHLENSLLCTLIGFVYYLGSIYLSLYVAIPLWAKVISLIVSVVGFVTYSPAQTKKRPIPEHQRKALKKKSSIILTIVALLSIMMHYSFPVFSSLLTMAAVCQMVNLLPVTYKIFREF